MHVYVSSCDYLITFADLTTALTPFDNRSKPATKRADIYITLTILIMFSVAALHLSLDIVALLSSLSLMSSTTNPITLEALTIMQASYIVGRVNVRRR